MVKPGHMWFCGVCLNVTIFVCFSVLFNVRTLWLIRSFVRLIKSHYNKRTIRLAVQYLRWWHWYTLCQKVSQNELILPTRLPVVYANIIASLQPLSFPLATTPRLYHNAPSRKYMYSSFWVSIGAFSTCRQIADILRLHNFAALIVTFRSFQ